MAKYQHINILGGGISGLSAAINLAKAGYAVDVFERNHDIGARFFGDLQGLENWTQTEDILASLTRMNIDINFDYQPFYSVVVSDNSRIKGKYVFNSPLCYLVKRGTIKGSIDQGLKHQALEAGVKLNFQHPLSPEEADIVATGPNTRNVFAVNKGIVFQTRMKDGMYVLLDNRLAYKGYAYLLISAGYACMCTTLFQNFEKINDGFRKTKVAFENWLNPDIDNPRDVGGIGSFTLCNIFQDKRSLFVGESAGVQDLLWGFGIRTSLQSGFLAAQSIIRGQDYAAMAKQEFEGKLKASLVNRFLFEQFGYFGYYFLIRFTKTLKNPFSFLHRAHRFSRIHRMIYPIAIRFMKRRYPDLRLS